MNRLTRTRYERAVALFDQRQELGRYLQTERDPVRLLGGVWMFGTVGAALDFLAERLNTRDRARLAAHIHAAMAASGEVFSR